MNRHQPSCLPSAVGSFTLGTQIDILGQVAVTHSRLGDSASCVGLFEIERVETESARRSGSRPVGLRR